MMHILDKKEEKARKPRIALMSHTMDNRIAAGTGLYARKLIEHMIEDDRFEWYLVHYDRVDDPLYKRAHEIIIPELSLPFATRFVRTLMFFWKYRKERFDIIHWFQPRLYPFFWLAPAHHIVVTAHGGGDVTAPGVFPFSRRVFNFVLTHFSRKIDVILASSDFGASEIIDAYTVQPARVRTIYLGGGEMYHPMDKTVAKQIITERYAIEGDFILDVSRHVSHKNIAFLIQAYIHARSLDRLRHKLVIAGSKNFEYEKNLSLARASEYAADIVFLEFCNAEDMNALYSAADLFVFPSLNEGFGLPVIEAFASGTPVIASNMTSLPEIVGDAGITIDPYNIEALANEMLRVLFDESLQCSFIQKGIARAQRFVWSRTAAETILMYRSLL